MQGGIIVTTDLLPNFNSLLCWNGSLRGLRPSGVPGEGRGGEGRGGRRGEGRTGRGGEGRGGEERGGEGRGGRGGEGRTGRGGRGGEGRGGEREWEGMEGEWELISTPVAVLPVFRAVSSPLVAHFSGSAQDDV